MAELVLIEGTWVPVPLALVYVEQEDLESDLLVGVVNDNPTDMLVGNDIFLCG